MNSLNILVVGTGMYTCGRGTDGFGTIMPALLKWAKDNSLEDIYIAGTSPSGVKAARDKIHRLSKDMGVETIVHYFPRGTKKDKKCYLEAIKKIPKPACAIVAVPDNLHKEVAGAAIQAGLHALVVKPVVSTVKELRELISLQDKNKTYCAVEFHKRLDLANLALKDTIAKKTIGDPLYFVVEYSQRKSIPHTMFKKWIHATNIFQYLGIHYIDIIYFATNAYPLRAMATGQKGWLYSKGIDAYDSIQAVVEWRMPAGKRFNSHILTNWIDPEKTSAMSDQRIKVVGTNGRFESDQKKRGITIVTDKKGTLEPNPYFCSSHGKAGHAEYVGYGIDSIHQFLDDVIKIEKGEIKSKELENKRPTFRQSLIPTKVLEAVNKSLKENGEWINIKRDM